MNVTGGRKLSDEGSVPYHIDFIHTCELLSLRFYFIVNGNGKMAVLDAELPWSAHGTGAHSQSHCE